jgi:hypothetical protein
MRAGAVRPSYWITRVHELWLNQPAMERLGVTKETRRVPFGTIERDEVDLEHWPALHLPHGANPGEPRFALRVDDPLTSAARLSR